MKKLISMILITATLLLILSVGVSAALGQDQNGVYLIGSAADLVEFKNMVNAAGRNSRFDAKLTANIDMSTVTDWNPIGDYDLINGSQENFGYLGVFDGNGKTISNLRMSVSSPNSGENYNTGLLFGVLSNSGADDANNSKIVDLTLKDSSLTLTGRRSSSQVFAGALCNNINRAQIKNVTLENVDIVATGFSSGIIGLIAQSGTYSPNLIDGCAVMSDCSITTDSNGVGCALVCGRSTVDTLSVTNTAVAGTVSAPALTPVAAFCTYLDTDIDLTGSVNNSSYADSTSCAYSTRVWSYFAERESELQGNVLNGKITDAQITEGSISGWEGESNLNNLFDENLFDTKFAGVFNGPVSISWRTTEAVTVRSYAFVTGNDSAYYDGGRNVKSWIFYGSNDGTNYTPIDAVDDGGLLRANHTAFVFNVPLPASYTYYKLTISSVANNANCQHDSFIILDQNSNVVRPVFVNPGLEEAPVDSSSVSIGSGSTYTGLLHDDNSEWQNAGNLFDADNTNKMEGWKERDKDIVVCFSTTEPVVVDYYAIGTGNDDSGWNQRQPYSWTLYGSNDGSSYTAIDSRSNGQLLNVNNQLHYFNASPTESYKHFKLVVTKVVAEAFTADARFYSQIGELKLYKTAPDSKLNFTSVSVTVQSDIDMNFKANGNFGAYTEVYQIIEFKGNKYTVGITKTEGDTKTFTFAHLGPHMMGDTMKATLYGRTSTGRIVSGSSTEISVRDYCVGLLNGSYSDAAKTVAADMLNYGAEAQRYVNYKTDSLVNSVLTPAQSAHASAGLSAAITDNFAVVNELDGASVEFQSFFLVLYDTITIRSLVTSNDFSGVSFEVSTGTGANRRVYSASLEQISYAEDVSDWFMSFNGITASNMRTVYNITAYKNGQPVSDTVSYSVESYAFHMIDDETVGALVRAMMIFGDSAAAYAAAA